ncbi:MAG: NAD(P)/FAD-dependent oxidoreductase [Chloroflexota bacterium]
MRIAVVGSGPAGMTAAYRLQQAGHSVEVLEAREVIGGRTHAERLGPGHHCDTGAGWLTTFYTRTLALLDELGLRGLLIRPRNVRGAADLLANGQLYRADVPGERAAFKLLSPEERQALQMYLERVYAEQPDGLTIDLGADDRDAESELASLGHWVVDYVFRPWFEGPFFTPLRLMSAAKLRSWLKAYVGATFYQVDGGMDMPWLRLAEQLEVRTGEPVNAARISAGGVELEVPTGARRYDGAVLACPAVISACILGDQVDQVLPWLGEVAYSPEVRVYAARPSAEDAALGIHLVPPTPVFSVEMYSGRRGAWGACPPDWQWALVCASGPDSAELIQMPAEEARRALWARARSVAPELFPLEEAAVVHDIRWEHAIPQLPAGHYTRLAAYERRPPVVLAGDWTYHACVEGAVRSGELAAAAFGQA